MNLSHKIHEAVMKHLSSMSIRERKNASENLIQDLFIDLRVKVNKWAALTQQTSQARMGYIGQHLTSIVTGFPGSKTGARGDDLVLPDGRHSEIKTCYRVDQLGECKNCHTKIATSDKICPACGSKDLVRKDDSKWLISIPATEFAQKEFDDLFKNENFYLVLFEFEDLNNPENIIISIWSVDPRNKGFAYCMLDYYKNIWAKSKSHAPFNLWPYSLKFEMMAPLLIYRSKIDKNGSIKTILFPELTPPQPHKLSDLTELPARSIDYLSLCNLAKKYGIPIPAKCSTKKLLKIMQTYRKEKNISDAELIKQLQNVIYLKSIAAYIDVLPAGIY